MTTSTTTPRLNYTADGSTTAFTFNFEIADSSSIAVYVGSTLKTLTVDYTVAFDSGTSGTGTVNFVVAPSSGNVTLIRDTNLARSIDFQEGGAFLAATVNAEFDKLTQAVIDSTDKIEKRAIRLAEPTTETPTLTIPDAATRASKILNFDGSGDLQVTDSITATVTGNVTGDLTGNVTGNLTGNVTGNVTGDLTGNVTGNVTGNLTGNMTSSGASTFGTLISTEGVTSQIRINGTDSSELNLQSSYINIEGNAGTQIDLNHDGNIPTIDFTTALNVGGSITHGSIATGIPTNLNTGFLFSKDVVLGNWNSGTSAIVDKNDLTLNALHTDGITVDDNDIITTRSNDNLNLTTAGTGKINLNGLLFPSADGTANQVLKTDGAGNLSFTDVVSYIDPITFVGDDSTGTAVNAGETFKIAGGTNITTAVSGDTLTITGTTAVGMTFVGDDSTGTLISDGETIKIAGAGGVTTAMSGDTLTITGPTGTLSNVVEDTTPELGGNLDVNSNSIVSTSAGNIAITPDTTGSIVLDGVNWPQADGTTGQLLTTNGSGQLSWVSPSGVGIDNVVDDLTPQLGGDLDVNGQTITSVSNGNIVLDPNGTGSVRMDGLVITDYTIRPFLAGQDIHINKNLSGADISLQLTNSELQVNDTSGSGSVNIRSSNATSERGMFGSSGALYVQNDSVNQNIHILPNGTGNIILDNHTWPNADGSAGEFLKTDGAGNLSFSADTVISDTSPQLGGNLDLNSNDITGTGSISITGDISTDAISLSDNTIKTTRSNDNLHIETAGTGRIFIGDNLDSETGAWSTAGSNVGNQLHYRDTAYTPSNGSSYPNSRTAAYTISADSSSGNRIRMMDAIDVEMDGKNLTSTSNGSGVQIGHLVSVKNSTASTSQLTKIQGNTSGAFFLGSGGQGTLDIEDMVAYRSIHQLSAASGDTIDIDSAYGFYATPTLYAGNNATTTFTNEYFFYGSTGTLRATNTYGVYIADDAVANRLGGINFQSDQIQAADTNDDLKIAENGTGEVNLVLTTQSTIGANGGASALTANPVGYIQVKVNGTQYVMPYYNR